MTHEEGQPTQTQLMMRMEGGEGDQSRKEVLLTTTVAIIAAVAAVRELLSCVC